MTDIFDALSHTDFLKLTLEAFSRQNFEVERSLDAGADAVLVGKDGKRIAVLCKKYRGAFIGRPVLQQFHAAMGRTGCSEGYLITTTDCLPEAREFAVGKGLDLYSRDRTTRLFLTAFGEEFMRTGRMPVLGQKAKTVPAPARKPVSIATYEKVSVPDQGTANKLVKVPVQVKPPEPRKVAEPPREVLAKAPVPVKVPEPIKATEPAREAPVKVPEPVIAEKPGEAQEPAAAPEPIKAAEPAPVHEAPLPTEERTPELEQTLPKGAGPEELTEEVQAGENNEPPVGQEAASPENTTTVTCAECNLEMRVPTDQGMVKVECTECGLRWIFQPEMKQAPKTVVICQTCSQQLSVPTDRGRLNVRCPKCRATWLFTP